MPIKGSYVTWDTFLEEYAENQSEFQKWELNSLINEFKKAAESYCSKYLLIQGIVKECRGTSDFKIFGKDSNVPSNNIGTLNTKIGGFKGYFWK